MAQRVIKGCHHESQPVLRVADDVYGFVAFQGNILD